MPGDPHTPVIGRISSAVPMKLAGNDPTTEARDMLRAAEAALRVAIQRVDASAQPRMLRLISGVRVELAQVEACMVGRDDADFLEG